VKIKSEIKGCLMQINKKKSKHFIYAVLALCITIPFILIHTHEASITKIQPAAKDGLLDLRAWDFEKDGIISLDGEWEFYWNRLLTYDDFRDGTKNIQPDAYVSVPDVWNSYRIVGENLSGEGCATYRLKIKSKDAETEKGLKIANMSTAYNLMVDNETIASNGIVSSTPEKAKAEYRPQAAVFKNNSGDYEIIIQISNYIYARGGLWYSIYMGTNQQIQAMKENSSRREMFIFGGIIMMMLYHLAIYIFLRKNISILYYVLMMLIIAARIPVTGEYLVSDVFRLSDIRVLVVIEYLTICWAPVTWLLFLNPFYPDEISKKVVRGAVYAGVFLTAFTLLAPVRIFTAGLLVYELMVVVLFVYVLIRFIAAVLRRREGVALMLLATAAFFATFINDALYQANMISSTTGGIFGYSAFIIIFIQAYVLAAQFSKTYYEVAEMSNKLLSLDQLKDEFLANTSHELRTPLNGIINITSSVIEDGSTRLDADQRQNLQVVVSAARRLYSLINDILDISSLKNGEIRLKIRPVDLRSVAGLTLYEIERQKNDREIEFINSIPGDFPPVEADAERLRQIFYNLMGNALKFTQIGRVEVGASAGQDEAEIWIEDTGCGIPLDKLEDIFKSFYQVDSAETRESGGTGLGLSITKNLIELHGGTIRVISEEGKGSRFVFTLPLSRENKRDIYVESIAVVPEEKAVLSGLATSEEREKSKYAILVAEDDHTNLRALMTVLKSEDYYIKAVTDGQQVLWELERQPNYDLLILDLMMPKLTGYQVLEAVRKRFSGIELPVILLTAKARQQDILAGFEAGANDYIAKPFEAEELKSRVSTLVLLKKSVKALVSAELNFLQAQIKPHFLYNALSVITSLSIREPKQAKELLMHLSDYLRGSFNFENHSGLVSLSEELQTVQAYLSIEEARFEERLRVEYDVEQDISASIPMLCLQPIVENAVRHGIMQRVEGGTVKVSVKAVDAQVAVTVEDDGVGMTGDRLAELFEAGEVKGVGIQNIHKRMLTMYGHGLQIESTPGRGTRVTMIIPVKPAQEVEA
jgi:signal transduction histidine kinase/AmiR/NasT family two-component response regulator